MIFNTDTPDSIDLGFELVPPGTHVWSITDNVELTTNEDTGSRTLRIPMVVEQTIKGEAASVGKPGSMMINVRKRDGDVNEFGEKQIAVLLKATGLIDHFIQKTAGKDIAPDNDNFVMELQLKLPGKVIEATHNFRQYKGKDGEVKNQMNFTNYKKYTKGNEPPKSDNAGQSEEAGW